MNIMSTISVVCFYPVWCSGISVLCTFYNGQSACGVRSFTSGLESSPGSVAATYNFNNGTVLFHVFGFKKIDCI